MIDIAKAKNIKKEMIFSVVSKLFREKGATEETLSNEIVNKIIKDVDISSALQKLERAVAGRKITPTAKKPELMKLEGEIQERFSGIKFNRIVNHLITARYYGYSCFEIVYNQDFSIDTLVPIPYDYITYSDKKWKIKIGTDEIELNRDKFLLNIHKWNPSKVKGTSIFESCHITFLDKEMYRKQLRGLAAEYGDIIIVYPYDVNMDKKAKEDLRQNIETLHNKKSIGVPVADLEENNFDLSKVVQFIKLSDLDPKIYTELEDREKEKLVQNILGSTLTMDNGGGTGSYSLGEVHKVGFDEVVEEICKFVTDSLFQLLEIDAKYHGYNPKDFEFILEKVFTDEEKVAQEKEQEGLKTIKLDNLQKLSSIGYKVTPEYISEQLGIDLNYIVEKPIVQPFNIANTIGQEFSNVDNQLFNTVEAYKQFEEYLKKKLDDFSFDVRTQIIEKLEKMKEGEEFIFDIDFKTLEDDLILSQIKSFTNSRSILYGQPIKEFNPFSMKFEEAIQTFLDKTPILYETIESISEEIRSNFIWIKKSTDLEITTKLFDNMKKSLENGGTFKEWLNDSSELVNKLGLGEQAYYLENVYRTNMFTQYSIGNYKQMIDVTEEFPYWEYHAIEDNRTSLICKRLNGVIYRYDDSFWSVYYPPNHFQCRSTVLARSKSDMKRLGLKVSKTSIENDEVLKGQLGSFGGNPAKVYWDNIKACIENKQGIFIWE